jgi:hypothetical protein
MVGTELFGHLLQSEMYGRTSNEKMNILLTDENYQGILPADLALSLCNI